MDEGVEAYSIWTHIWSMVHEHLYTEAFCSSEDLTRNDKLRDHSTEVEAQFAEGIKQITTCSQLY